MVDDRPHENSSRARDHLSNERVFLAWLRTAAEVMVLGLFVAKLAGKAGASALDAGTIVAPRADWLDWLDGARRG